MFYTAEITFSDPETMELVMTDSVVARDREHELVRVLEKSLLRAVWFQPESTSGLSETSGKQREKEQ